jgi:RNA polymerase sigma-70 factor (sigma-E family)
VRLRRERSALAARDEAEFESYVASDGGRLLGFALLLAGNYQDAEDLVQVALLRLASRWPAARQNPQGYARTILVNLARDRWRVRRRRQPETLVADVARLPRGAAHDGATAVLERQALLCACRLLPAAQRAVLVLRFWEDRSIEETAAVLGCTPGTVKSHTHRALRRLRAVLQEAPDEAMPPVPLVPGPAVRPVNDGAVSRIRRIDRADRS